MKLLVKVVYILFSVLFFVYLLLPNTPYPPVLLDSLQSTEPADTELNERRAYFTNFNRSQVLDHYTDYFKNTLFYFDFMVFRLNYPPEDSRLLIRDQTRSTFLEEIVIPFRESFFVNGFEPKDEKDAIFIEGRRWLQKVTVRHVASGVFVRIFIAFLALVLVRFVFVYYAGALLETRLAVRNLFKK